MTISYRGSAFSCIKARNHARITEAIAQGKVTCVFDSEVQEIAPDTVRLRTGGNAAGPAEQVLKNDEVFIMAGGVPPFRLLEDSGVSFDPADRPPPPTPADKNTGLTTALLAALALAVVPVAWYGVFRGYYALSIVQRPTGSPTDRSPGTIARDFP